jgi:SWI/SNF-related matrix-associated actin-dependent regulator 1 of chromatin subfamily A
MHNFDRFLRDPGCRLLVGNIEAAGVGLSALGVSNTAFAELAWRPSDHDQAEDRTHGLGRGSEGVRSTSYYFVAIDTIEQHLIELLHAKQRTISSVLDGGEGASEFDVLEQLTKRMTT